MHESDGIKLFGADLLPFLAKASKKGIDMLVRLRPSSVRRESWSFRPMYDKNAAGIPHCCYSEDGLGLIDNVSPPDLEAVSFVVVHR